MDGVDDIDDDEIADEFRTPEALPLPRRDGPKVLDYKGPWMWFVLGQLETLVDIRSAHDVEDARALYDEVPAWLAALLSLEPGKEEAVLGLAEELRRRDPELPILLASPKPADEALTSRALLLDAHVIVDGKEAGEAIVAFLRRAVARRGSLTDRLVRMLMEVYGLSVTEARVVRLTIAGESRSDIAKMLFVSANTVDRHAARIHQRIGRPLKSLRGREAEGLLEELDVKLKKAAARAG